ncbi:S8 family serine peptidase [Roseomonas harenae]|uniref:S8 family serine peptidase n=1 Tax=Muricoccus harenae TaxID=2692566 RepID=UPI002E2BA4CA|nr:S8 family serine peptidase [Roseomonas harenae]
MVLFESDTAEKDALPFGVDPVLRAAALALVMDPNQTEFGVLAFIPDGSTIRARPGLRFGHAVREADGTILPPNGGPPRSDGGVFAAMRIDLAPIAGLKTGDFMEQLLGTLGDLADEGWAMQVERVAAVPSSATMAAIHARPADLPVLPPRTVDGTGVLVGAVDFGCAFAHPAFRNGPDGLGGTRLRLLWDQNGATPPGANLPGHFYGPAELDALLDLPNPYPAGGYVPWEKGYAPEDAGPAHSPAAELSRRARVHGTHVLSLAGGRQPAEGPWASSTPPGIAPGAALAFVHLRPRALVSEGDATDVFDGVCALFELARREGMPAVVNLSIGANTGAHDGQGLMDRAFNALLRTPGRAITVAAGNMRGACQHRSGRVTPDEPATLHWRFAAGDPTVNMLRVYSPLQAGRPVLDIALGRPDEAPGSALPPDALRQQPAVVLRDAAGRDMIGTAASTIHPPSSEEPIQHVEIRLKPSAAEESWQVTLSLRPDAATVPWEFAAWIERDDLRPFSSSRFEPPLAPEAETGCSLGSLACADGPICVGAYTLPDGEPAPFSSLGPTRIGRLKPDVAAPGKAVIGASGLGGLRDGAGQTHVARVTMDGTSAAAPQVAGVVALMLQARPRLTAERISEILRKTTLERQAHAGAAWKPDLGAGRVDAAAALAMTLEEPE